VQKAKLGINLKSQDKPFPTEIVDGISLKTNMTIAPIAPNIKWKKKLTN
jgi:hypothetical protein